MGDKTLLLGAALLAPLAAGPDARADDITAADQARARAAFEEGRAARLEGNYREARADFATSYEIDHKPGTMLNLAACDEELGHMATAWRELLRGAAEARRAGRQDWAANAEREAERTEPTLPRLVLHLERGPDPDERRFSLDGAPFPDPMIDAAMPVDAGPHRIEAAAPGKRLWATSFEAKPESVSLVTVPLLEPEAFIPTVTPSPAAWVPRPPSRSRQTTEIALGATGSVFALAAAALTVSAYVTYQEAGCTTLCTSLQRAAQDRAWTQANVATVLGGVGAGALAGVALLWMWDPGRAVHLEAKPVLGPNAIAVSLKKTW